MMAAMSLLALAWALAEADDRSTQDAASGAVRDR
jgi:hypothetical protein